MKILTRLLLLAFCLARRRPRRSRRDPMAIIAAFKSATGGAAWDGMDGLYRTDTHRGQTFLHLGRSAPSGDAHGEPGQRRPAGRGL